MNQIKEIIQTKRIKEVVVYAENFEVIFIELDNNSFTNPINNSIINFSELEKIIANYEQFGCIVVTVCREEEVKEIEFDDLDDFINQSICIIAINEENQIYDITLNKIKGNWFRQCNNQKIEDIKECILNLEKSGFQIGFYDKDWQLI